ncbi:GNAT family N-acetyltransferase [Streptomyces griseoaurantiacus]|uniref:GNAT family N-acetyltransferase n=1 Tax=Streptomyces griseoaurantiacus TaxID=68213 RepID=UPI002E2C0F19|nr:GNAT family N-acetyltransferase [Streptomyces jietaisiensis]
MPVHDARTGAEAATEAGLGASTASSPTTAPAAPAASPTTVPAAPAASPAGGHEVPAESDCETTLSMRPVREFTAPAPEGADAAPAPPGPADDLLGRIGDWDPLLTPVGTFRLLPVRPERDTALLARWMNDPAVAAFWELDGPEEVTGRHLRAQLEGEGHSVPCLGVLDGTVMSYWELYRADLAPLARHYPARPHDTGVHLLLGAVADRGRGLGSALLRSVTDLVLDHRPACARVVAEPDLRNTASLTAFLSAGFRFSAELSLPGKRAALMIRDRSLRHLM